MSNNPFIDLKQISELLLDQDAMKNRLQKVQKEMMEKEVVGESGGGMVRIVLAGGSKVKSVHLDPSLAGDLELLQDLIAAAGTDALEKSKRALAEQIFTETQPRQPRTTAGE